MTVKSSLRKLVETWTGFRFYREKYLPLGFELEVDLRKFSSQDFKTVLDIGAHVGQSALRYHSWFPQAKIYSFEPVSATYSTLEENLAGLDRIETRKIAFGSDNYETDMILKDNPLSMTNSLKTTNVEPISQSTSERVAVRTIDSFLDEHDISVVDFLKIDTEGYELEVLEGARNALGDGRIRVIFCEVGFHDQNTQNTPIELVHNYFKQYEYHLFGFYETNLVKISNGRLHSNALYALTIEVNAIRN